jgi:hypothetical protein
MTLEDLLREAAAKGLTHLSLHPVHSGDNKTVYWRATATPSTMHKYVHAMTPEGRVKPMVKKALDTLGADCWRFMPVQTGYGSPALDYLLSIRGRFVAIETKAPGKKLTPLQEGTKAAIEAAGGIVLTVWDESSLAIAMKIILALEFTSNALDAATRGHHGAPRTSSKRRP